jgi:hypothetical protein
MSEENIEIDENNFYDYFTPITKRRPLQGEVIASYRASAELVDGGEKRQVIQLLKKSGSAISATKILGKLCYMIESDAIRVSKEIVQDLADGMTDDEVAAKPYKYTLEMFFYANPKHIPVDEHWMQISILSADKLNGILRLDENEDRVYGAQFDVGDNP